MPEFSVERLHHVLTWQEVCAEQKPHMMLTVSKGKMEDTVLEPKHCRSTSESGKAGQGLTTVQVQRREPGRVKLWAGNGKRSSPESSMAAETD